MKFLKENNYLHSDYRGNIFDTKTTGFSYYDDFLTWQGRDYNRRTKGLTSNIMLMSPEDYIYNQHYYGHRTPPSYSVSEEINILKKQLHDPKEWQTGISSYEYFENMLKNGEKLPMPYLNKADKGQEGRHRAIFAMEKGETKIPVLVVKEFNN